MGLKTAESQNPHSTEQESARAPDDRWDSGRQELAPLRLSAKVQNYRLTPKGLWGQSYSFVPFCTCLRTDPKRTFVFDSVHRQVTTFVDEGSGCWRRGLHRER